MNSIIDLKIGICPHDVVHDADKWTIFADYITKKNNLSGKFEKYFSFETFAQQFTRMNFIYAHPLHAVHLQKILQFIPLVKYKDKFDEAVIICQKDNSKGIQHISNQKVACVYGSPSHAALLIDLHRNNKNINFQASPLSSYPEVANVVNSGQIPFGIILKESWDHMKDQYPALAVLYTTYTKELVHAFMLSPKAADIKDELNETLLNMHLDEKGKEILDRLGCRSFEIFSYSDLKKLEASLSVCRF